MLIDDNETFATTIKGKVFTDNPKEFNIVLIHNPTKETERVSYYTKYFTKMVNQVKQLKKIKPHIIESYEDYLDIEQDESGKLISVKSKIINHFISTFKMLDFMQLFRIQIKTQKK
ncbi:hypothetical protein NW064_01195 [Mycoplasmopsis felis]|uniref:hypothetical protein n=1 Tax=Mycoplasmopsis felis TaxID=33923 RepID=UPI0021AF17CE|nr:hypothetical protein [Mycoplasmopsis felis]UWW01046.1 hypothetical protein NW064_01195 [Mycoplasmopsis felis]